MCRAVFLVLALALATACPKKTLTTTPPISIATEEIAEDTKKVEVKIGYRSAPEREVELVVDLKAIGIEEMDKLVVDISVDGFVLVKGEPQWSGFVAPRIPVNHRASFRLLEGGESGTLKVSVQRSADSTFLLEREIAFAAEGDRVAPTS